MSDCCYDPAASTPGTTVQNVIVIMEGDVNPSIGTEGAGTVASMGTFYRRSNGELWYKNGDGNFDWFQMVTAPV